MSKTKSLKPKTILTLAIETDMMGDMGFEAITFIWAFTTIRSVTTHNNSIKKYKRLRLKQIYIYT